MYHDVVDGLYGPNTENAVKQFQSRCVQDKLEGWEQQDVDTVAGVKTCLALWNATHDID
jgi:hypothetical protein